ncbi:MAG TPA: TonB-dependent receptor [Pyrinomonadaceae bacterium]|nr:TonB-dependent receptor [Pyrinomonadaceae bacterium]
MKRVRFREPSFRLLRLLIICSLLITSGEMSEARSQQNVTSATLSGRVTDANDAAVSGASVTVTNMGKNLSWTASTGADGRFRFSFLPAGDYRLRVEQAGFANLEESFSLNLGQTLDVPVHLTLATVTGSVNITSDVPLVETARTQVSETITPREVDSLPLNGRNYLDLALLAPAVSRTNTGSNQRFAETSAVPGTGISIAGQRNLNNSFIIDGLSANDDAAGLAGTFYSQEVIREFQVVTSGGIAEFGRASGGVVNIVTQSGDNQFRGRLYGFFRNQRLDARNPLATTKDPLTQGQYGASLGGPLRRDSTFFFTNFEQTRRNDVSITTIAPASVSAINEQLNRVGYRGPRLVTGAVPGGYDVTNLFARIDHRLSASSLLTARYSLYDISSVNSRTVGGLNDLSRGTNLETLDQTVAASLVTTLSPDTVNEARFQFTRSRLRAPVNDAIGPAVNIQGVASFGTATFSPLARATDMLEVADSITAQRGQHSLKGGVNLLYNRLDILFPGAFQGVYTFSSLSNFLAGRFVTYQQAFGAPSQFQTNPNLGLFAQDEWRPREGLTVNAGLRYDLQWLPSPIETDVNNFSPRVGVAFAPGDRKTVIRASFGVYFDRVPLRATSNALQRDGIKYRVAVLSFGQAGAPAFPNVLAEFPATLLTSITTIDPEVENSYSRQASLQVERELGSGTSLSIAYLHLRGMKIIMSRNVNVPTLSAAEATRLGVPNLGRPDSRFANVSRFESAGHSYYDGLTVSLNRRLQKWSSVRFSYTYSKAIDDSGNFFFSTPQNNFDIRDDRGLSDNDQRHRLTLSGTLEAPGGKDGSGFSRVMRGFQLSYIFTYASPLPFNIQTGTDRNNDTTVNDRPAGVGRNTGRGFDFASLDLRLSRKLLFKERFQLEMIVEAFNVLNRANLQLPNNIFGIGQTPLPAFRQPTATADPRQLQLGLRFSF